MRLAGALVLALALAADAAAQPLTSLAGGEQGHVEFRSATPTGPTQLVRRDYDPAGTTISGTLLLPPGAAERVPAMVILHGSGGLTEAREHAWARRFAAMGVAGFVVDSFGPRGMRSTAADQSRLSTMANTADALAALRLLATHPRIDPARIGAIGFSRGGQAVLYSALEPLRRGMIDGELRFAAHVALYSSCATQYVAESVTRAPMLVLFGGADDYTPPAACARYVEWFRSRGASIQTILYPGAHHGFDSQAPLRFIATAETARECSAEMSLDTLVMRRLDTGESLLDPQSIRAYYRGCTRRGATFGGDAAALDKAVDDVGAFVRRVLRP